MRLTSSRHPRANCVSTDGNQPICSHRVSWVSTSAVDPCAIARKCALSRVDSRVQPSAMLQGMDTTARVNWLRIPYTSSRGNNGTSR
jgi:hypothetical protein